MLSDVLTIEERSKKEVSILNLCEKPEAHNSFDNNPTTLAQTMEGSEDLFK